MSEYYVLAGIIFSAALSFLLIPRVIKFGHRHQFLDMPGRHKRHKKPVPPLGGLILFVVCWATVLLFLLIDYSAVADIAYHLLFIFFGALLLFLVGLSDDIKPLAAIWKLAAQVAAGLLLYYGGLSVEFLTLPFGSVEIGGWSVVITVVWVVMLTNAINLIDGLDGLATGVSLIGAVTILVIGQLYQAGIVLLFVLVLIGFLAIFLYFNKYPARIFLGDSGSMQIGYYFAVFSLMFPLKSYTVSALYLPLLALGVPLMEIGSSIFRRILSGKKVMGADRRHLFHFLSILGLSSRQVLLVFYLLAIIYGLFAIAMYFWNRVYVFTFLVFFMVVIFSIFYILVTKFKPENYRKNRAEKER